MSFVSMWKASGVQQGKRFTLPLKGEALSPKTLVDQMLVDARRFSFPGDRICSTVIELAVEEPGWRKQQKRGAPWLACSTS